MPHRSSLSSTGVLHKKIHLHHEVGSLRHRLGEALEGKFVISLMLILIVVDIICTAALVVIETDVLNPKYHARWHAIEHWAEYISFRCLVVFLAEQLLHLVAFGVHFFKHPWYAMSSCVAAAPPVSPTTSLTFLPSLSTSASLLLSLLLNNRYVLDLFVVLCTLYLEIKSDWVHTLEVEFIMALRLWKGFVFAFDIVLAQHTQAEIEELANERKEKEKEL